jgi:general secretion pathway protein K
MMIVAIAAAIAVQIAFAHQIWFRQMENVADRDATDWLRRGALHWASLALLEDAGQNSIDHLGENWAMALPTLPVEGGAIKVSIEDAQARFNLNSIAGQDATSLANLEVLKGLLRVLRLEPLLANAVADWIDPDSEARAGGAEDIDYLNLNPPYRAANRPMASVDELRLIRGFDVQTVRALLPYVTVLPVATNTINVNTVSPVVLAALTGIDLQTAERIVKERVGKPFNNTGEFNSKLAPLPSPAGIDVKSAYFLVTLDTSIGRHERHSEALLRRDAGRSTTVLWHRPQPLIGGEPQASDGSDEPDVSK